MSDNNLPVSPTSLTKRRGTPALIAAALCLGLGLAYLPGVNSPFYLDDVDFLARKPTIRSIDSAWRIMPTRRVCAVSFAVDYQLHGLNPTWFRVTNITIHAVAGLVLFGIIRRTLAQPGIAGFLAERATLIAAIAAAAWTLHPLQTGAVTYVVQRFESLMGCAFLVAIYALLRSAISTRPWPWHCVGLLAVAIGSQSKEIMAVFPIVAIAFDRIYLSCSWRELAIRRGWLHLLYIVVAAWMVFSFRVALSPAHSGSAGFGVRGVTSWEYLRSQPGVLLHYLKLCFWPDTLCLDYQWPIAHSPWEIYAKGLVILALLGATAWAVFRCPRIGFLGICFFTILAPTSSVMPIADLAFEHRMYLPLAPVLSLATLGMIAVSQRLLIRPTLAYRQFAAVASIAVLTLAIRTAVRNLDYLSPLRMWHSVVAVSPWNFRAHHQLALQYESRGMVAQAEHHFAETLRCRPDAWWVDIGLGNLRVRQNRFEEAEAHFRKALAVKAGTALATANLARLYERRGDWPQAVRFYEASVDANPRNLDIRMAKARAHEKAGQIPQAVQAYREILNLDPRSREAKAALDKLPNASGDQPNETRPPISITNK